MKVTRPFLRIVALLGLAGALFGPAPASAQTPPEGVPLQVRRGFFTETDIGGFVTFGGDNGYSNLQTYLQLGVGYDLSKAFEIAGHVGIGSNSTNCFSTDVATGLCVSESFTVTFLDVSAAYLIGLTDRLYLAPKLLAGYTLLDPAPIKKDDGRMVSSGPNAGIGLGIEYATSMEHFSIGFDVVSRMILGANILTMQFFPRVKYTF